MECALTACLVCTEIALQELRCNSKNMKNYKGVMLESYLNKIYFARTKSSSQKKLYWIIKNRLSILNILSMSSDCKDFTHKIIRTKITYQKFMQKELFYYRMMNLYLHIVNQVFTSITNQKIFSLKYGMGARYDSSHL